MNPKSSETNEFPVTADGDLLARAQLLREAVTVLDEPFHRDAVACTLLEAADGLDALVEKVRTLRANERMAFEQLSDALSAGNAGTWDDIFHAVRTLRAQVTWQPIETADRKVGPFLLCDAAGERWTGAFNYARGAFGRDDEWLGWVKATHWMPLPSAPTEPPPCHADVLLEIANG